MPSRARRYSSLRAIATRFSQSHFRQTAAVSHQVRTTRLFGSGMLSQARRYLSRGHSRSVKSVAFSLDGSRIVSGSDDRTIRLWDAKSGKEVFRLGGYNSHSVKSVAFSPDGSRIASSSNDGTIRLWDAKSGKKVLKLKGHSGSHLRFEPSSDTRLLLQTAAGSIDLDVGSLADNNHGVRDSVGDRASLVVESNDQLPSDQQPASNGKELKWGLNRDGSWITWYGRGTIWLPPDFRPGQSDVSKNGSTIAIGRRTGRMVIMRMALNVPFS